MHVLTVKIKGSGKGGGKTENGRKAAVLFHDRGKNDASGSQMVFLIKMSFVRRWRLGALCFYG
jgi:hypothetical protein